MRSTDPVFNMTFVGVIERHPCLYAFDSADYNNRAIQEKAWESVASEVKESVSDCKERWKNIRGCYTRYLKLANMPGSGGKKQPYYLSEALSFLLQYTKSRKSFGDYFPSLEPSMSSLEPSVTLEESSDHREDDCSASLSQDAFAYDHENSSDVKIEHEFAPPPAHKKIKLSNESFVEAPIGSGRKETTIDYLQYNKELREEKKTEESDLAFLTSLMADMKEMSRNQKRRFKIGILNLAGQILSEPVGSSCPQDDLGMTPASSCSSSPASTLPQR